MNPQAVVALLPAFLLAALEEAEARQNWITSILRTILGTLIENVSKNPYADELVP